MKIDEVAEKLTKCANLECEECEHLGGEMPCVDFLIKDMAAELRKIAEEMKGEQNDRTAS